MGEQFFLSSEFENLVDLSALTISVFLLPLAWTGWRRAEDRITRLALLGFWVSANLILALQALRSGYSLASNLPFSARYFLPLTAAADTFVVGALAALLWRRAGIRGRGMILAATVLGALAEGVWLYRSSLAELPLIYRGLAAYRMSGAVWISAIRVGLLLVAIAVFLGSDRGRGFRRLLIVSLFIGLRELLFLRLIWPSSNFDLIWISSAGEVLLASASVLVAVTFYDFEQTAARSFAFRLFILSFVATATVSLTLSFNYILRARLLDESLVRYQGEGRRIAADINQTIDHLSDSLARLAEPSVFQFFSTRFHTSSSAVSELGLDLVRGYIPKEFHAVNFTDTADSLLFAYVRAGEDVTSMPVLTAAQIDSLSVSPGRVFIYRIHEESRGDLLYEAAGSPAIREEAVRQEPVVLFAASVRNRSGGVQGFVKAVMKTRTLLDLMTGYGNTSGWDFIASTEGVVLAHSRLGYTGFRLDGGGDSWREAIQARRWYPLDLPGGRVYLALFRLEEMSWVVARSVSTTTIVESTQKLRGATLLLFVITVLIAAVTATGVSIVLTRQRVAIERMGFEVERKRVLEERNRALDLKNRELAAERRRIEAILVSIGEGVAVLDAENRVVFMNGAARRIFRIREDQEVADLTVEDMGLRELPAQIEVSRSGGRRSHSFLSKAGDVDVRVTMSQVKADDDVSGPTVLAIQDITELMRVDRMKTEIIAIVSHSLRTPLTAVKSFTEILKTRVGKLKREQELEYLDVIERSTDRLTRIVNNLLDLSKVASGRMHFRFEQTDLDELVRESIELVSGAAQSKNITISCCATGQLPKLPLDRLKFKQVMDNLLGNSLKFTPAGGRIEVTVCAVDGSELVWRADNAGINSGAGYVLVSVRDTGIGIRKQNLERVFDKFFQDDYVRQSTEGGTGLGLAISREYVLAHGGVIWAEIPEGGGAQICVALPVMAPLRV